MTDSKRLLIVYHSQSGTTARLAKAVARSARQTDGLEVTMLRASDADCAALLACDGLLLGTPENFGYMSGVLKDFFDRTYYPCEGRLSGLPYGMFISAGNDGRGAEREIRRIAAGYGWRQAAETVIVRGDPDTTALQRCRELGEGFATAVALGIF